MRIDEAHLVDALHDEVILAGHEALEDVEHAIGEVLGELGRAAEVENDDARLTFGTLLDEEVPGVRVGVEEPVDEELLVEDFGQLRRDGVRIEIEQIGMLSNPVVRGKAGLKNGASL